MSRRDDRLNAFYAARAREEPAHDPEAHLRFAKALGAAGLVAGERLLDVGAKWGGLAAHVADLAPGVDYTGVDLSEHNVERARSSGLDVRLADVAQGLPFDEGEFDCIVCLELLEHLAEPVALLEELRRVLRPTGRIVVSVPNPYSWVEIFRELVDRPDPEGHLTGFTTPVMRNVLALSGFELERRLGTSLRLPKTSRVLSTDSVGARSRIFVARPSEDPVFAGRRLGALGGGGP
jgi:2-polyprenyl-3-methyl-5-hydroxy-6-metoxy-1,4-benzoquinol methylase